MKSIFIIACLCFICAHLSAQRKIPTALQERLEGKTRFYDIKEEVLSYYAEEKSRIAPNDSLSKRFMNRQLKFWNRWFYECESRLETDGTVANWTEKIYEVATSANEEISSRAPNSDWNLVGPTNVDALDGIGRVNRLAFHPTNAQTIYAGAARGGLFRSTNGGSSWSSVSGYIPSLGISGIEISRTDPSTMYILTGDGDAFFSEGLTFKYGYVSYSNGVLKTTDGGATWQKTAPFPSITNQYVGFQLRQDPNNSNTYLAATSDGLYRTTNGGGSWTEAEFHDENDVLVNISFCFDIEYKPGSSSIVYAGARYSSQYRFFKSTNGGLDFFEIDLPNSVEDDLIRFEIGVTPAAANNVYLLCGPGYIEDGDGSNDSMNGFLRSTNSGDAFSLIATEPDVFAYNPSIGPTFGNQCFYDMALAISPTNSNYIFTGGLVVFRSTDGGFEFDGNTTYWIWEVGEHTHPDIHDLKYNPLDGKLYCANDGGVHVSPNNGGDWGSLFSGLSITQFYHSEPDNQDGRFWGGTQDNGVLDQLSGGTFGEFQEGDGYDVMTDNIVGNGNDSYWTYNSFMSTTEIEGDVDITPPQPNDNESRWFGNMDMHPTDEDYIYVGYKDAVWYSDNQGGDWEDGGYYNRLDGGAVSGEWCIQVCPSLPSRIYCAGEGNLWRVDGISFGELGGTGDGTSIRSDLIAEGFPVSGGSTLMKVTDIMVHPSSSLQVWVTASGFTSGAKVFYSADGGGTWNNISYTLPNVPANCLIRDSDGTVYVGTDMGVYYLPSGGNDWIPFYNDLPRTPVTELNFVIINGIKYLYASTYGRGIWRSQTFTGCTSTLSISETLRGQQFFQASTSISSTSIVDAGNGTKVFFQSGDNITLTTGFEGKQGVLFRGYIQPCNSGPIYEDLTMPDDVFVTRGAKEGVIKSITPSGEKLNVLLEIRESGDYSVALSKSNGSVVSKSPVMKYHVGNTEITLDNNDLKDGYVYLVKGNEVVHLQEFSVLTLEGPARPTGSPSGRADASRSEKR